MRANFGKFRVVMAASLLAGCVSAPMNELSAPAEIASVAVTVENKAPEIRLSGFAQGKLEGAALLGAGAFAACGGALMQGGCEGAICGGVATLVLGVCTVMGGVGMVSGAMTAAPSGRVAETKDRLRQFAPELPENLRRQLILALQDDGVTVVTDALTASHRLEVTGVRTGLRGEGVNPPLRYVSGAHLRLLDVRLNRVVMEQDVFSEGATRSITAWSEQDGLRLRQSQASATTALAQGMADLALRTVILPQPRWPVGRQGLAAVDPASTTLPPDQPGLGRWAWPRVDSVQPELRWEAFPREQDIRDHSALATDVTEVRYELRIARAENNVPGPVVYQREGLREPAHRLETPLDARTPYFWTVRAVFLLNGRTRVTPWSRVNNTSGWPVDAPSRFAFRFRTP